MSEEGEARHYGMISMDDAMNHKPPPLDDRICAEVEFALKDTGLAFALVLWVRGDPTSRESIIVSSPHGDRHETRPALDTALLALDKKPPSTVTNECPHGCGPMKLQFASTEYGPSLQVACPHCQWVFGADPNDAP